MGMLDKSLSLLRVRLAGCVGSLCDFQVVVQGFPSLGHFSSVTTLAHIKHGWSQLQA
jgi:hypothetical protein